MNGEVCELVGFGDAKTYVLREINKGKDFEVLYQCRIQILNAYKS